MPPACGFLVLADQYFPGWHATVNGNEVPIRRANHIFRLVEIPSGTSRVVPVSAHEPRSRRRRLGRERRLLLVLLSPALSGSQRGTMLRTAPQTIA